MSRASLDKRPADISTMFDAVAERYDLLNDVLSLGQDRRWRSAVAKAVAAGPCDLVLDVAAGTGTSARAFTHAGARCVACDFSIGMLTHGARKPAGPVSFVAGDALALPFADRSFDAVTISFGLRNVADPVAALTEMLRVTRPGGKLVICEFSHLRAGLADAAYQRYLAAVLPALAGLFSRHRDAYRYLAESIGAWPTQRELAGQIRAAGWSQVRWRNLTLGVVALHAARRAVHAQPPAAPTGMAGRSAGSSARARSAGGGGT